MIYISIALIILLPVAVIAWRVDDWSRDLSTNEAMSDPVAEHPMHRPMEAEFTLEHLETAIASLCSDKSQWSVATEPQPAPLAMRQEDPALVSHHLIRTTSLLRFKDDVWVVAEDAGNEKLRLRIYSRSRLGKGDLGQNPRNVRELTTEMFQRIVYR